MLQNKDGKTLWIADEAGGYEILRPGDGYNGRTREPGEPDWWVEAREPGWEPPGMLLEAGKNDPSASGPVGLGEPPEEPWSVLQAKQEHLDHLEAVGFNEAAETIGQGVGEALEKGAQGAGEALSRTWDELTGNKELHKGVEFGVKAAGEVSKDVGATLFWDGLANTWDAAAAEGLERLGLKSTAKAFSNSAITLPLNKVISAGRLVKSVGGGGAGAGAKDLGRRIDAVHEDVYGRKR